ncbi:MAG: hypothetical protein HXX15_10250 [Rhodopseudomonas sp.]|uniref:hypothetical protein n=1 Tax=Rhodopseudomonas sp. TaxID=1078 RepID=UPI0017E2856B|nr:hypothetical protein [Rhodopseudomonas sp.]NVN86456.1 hypothetical protein [Rhodopseudomonas sp.]
MPPPPMTVAAADAFNNVRRETLILILPATFSCCAIDPIKQLVFGHHPMRLRSSDFRQLRPKDAPVNRPRSRRRCERRQLTADDDVELGLQQLGAVIPREC